MPSVPKWICEKFREEGDVVDILGNWEGKELHLYYRNILELIQELLENPDFKDQMHYSPSKMYTDNSKSERIYSEMWSGNWWHETLVG